MGNIQWARAGQFNWTFDAMGGTPLMEAVHGKRSGISTFVGEDGAIILKNPLLGGGQVFYLRGVWKTDAVFPWNGFWAEPESGDLTDYFVGGTWQNMGNQTVIILGRPLPAGTAVQIYYIYFTGEKAEKYAELNSYPCIRPAWRGCADYTFDFAVDRIFDLMAILYFAGLARNMDNRSVIEFLWESYFDRAASAVPPLVFDRFERTRYDRGQHLLYRGSSQGESGFSHFDIDLEPETQNRALHVIFSECNSGNASAWLGYGLNWDLGNPPFNAIDRLFFSYYGNRCQTRVANCNFVSSGGTAELCLQEDYNEGQACVMLVIITKGGELGEAEFTFELYRMNGADPEMKEEGLLTSHNRINLHYGVQVWWELGSTFVVGDYWCVTLGRVRSHPRRLQIILNDSEPGACEAWGPEHTFVHALPDRYDRLTDFEIPFTSFWRLDNVIYDGDRRRTGWNPWCSLGASQPQGIMSVQDHEEEQEIEGEVFYTQAQLAWDLPEDASALGFWTGINTAEVDSGGRSTLNFLIRPNLANLEQIPLTVKVKDSLNHYFVCSGVNIPAGVWSRVDLSFNNFIPEISGHILTHPIKVVDIGLCGPDIPLDGSLYLTDVKFGSHRVFSGSRLRLVEFKHHEPTVKLPAYELWLDNVGLNLTAYDHYPHCPRLAISVNPYGVNPWRGPTLIHYAHPLGAWLVDRHDVRQNHIRLHRDAQDEFNNRYGGVKGPILPVHTRNDIENIALCGEENFNEFCWWPKYRDYGRRLASWLFNGSLQDATGNYELTWSSGSPVYTTGICQPNDTALHFDGSGSYAGYYPGTDFRLGDGDFFIEAVVSFDSLVNSVICGMWYEAANQRSWLVYYNNYNRSISFYYSIDGTNILTIHGINNLITATGVFHHISVVRSGETIYLYIDGNPAGSGDIGTAGFYDATADFRIGRSYAGANLYGDIDYLHISKDIAPDAAEIAGRWQIIQGLQNGSDYPEVGHGLGQYWAFYRLAEYFCVSNDAGAWDILDNWLSWLETFVVADGLGWKFPVWFSEYGFTYGDYDPGAAAAIVIGCLYIYMRKGDSRALGLAQNILADLRLNRASGDYGGYLYKSDYHYAWMNALVAHAFGLAVAGRAGSAYIYPYTPDDKSHFTAMMNNFWAMSGDTKPNLLNSDGIPFSYVEDLDVWDYAPHYLFMRQMGSLEAVVLMAVVALDWGLHTGIWHWFEQLIGFIILNNRKIIPENQIRFIQSTYDLTLLKNLGKVFFADYRQNQSSYREIADASTIDLIGCQPVEIHLEYGQPVITEDPGMAEALARLLIERFSSPKELVDLETWMEGARIELKDNILINSKFHGYDNEPFVCYRKKIDLDKKRISLQLVRNVRYLPAWGEDLEGGEYGCYAIDTAVASDLHWNFRTYAF
ncbi:MAG TPA: hypothetical protein DCY27_13685 [Desulfobacterales bacterium]|nr:hypothetical protein [Desulfobacterales bacterium]